MYPILPFINKDVCDETMLCLFKEMAPQYREEVRLSSLEYASILGIVVKMERNRCLLTQTTDCYKCEVTVMASGC